jgi:uncharacterized protein
MEPFFEWDKDKARTNLRKHGLSFDEGVTVFNDPHLATIADPDHSDDEERFIALGFSARGRLLVVVYTERQEGTRIISCRKATAAEQNTYDTDI